ncbi:RING finger protein 112-like [Mauremys reevesii]|uniref:RING finger protein 112-like n=1 Tax=Mauremys reevesii TaxID=260615 RepID=UPI0019401B72|nr:RING finger protein 112-like [Mauremys reevesii]
MGGRNSKNGGDHGSWRTVWQKDNRDWTNSGGKREGGSYTQRWQVLNSLPMGAVEAGGGGSKKPNLFGEDCVTCSICLDVLEDPVSIECGHNFCWGCLSAHSSQTYRCPECHHPCSKHRMIPDSRVKSLVQKFRNMPQSGRETERQGPGAQPEPGRPVQLVRLDDKGDLTLDEEALSRCLEQGGVGDAPVCLVSIIGEQRRGKSFLLNYLLRRLRSLDARDGSWMGQEDEPLEGFKWRADEQQVTKGVWAWSQPFWVPAKGGKVAVLLVDTEGSMDLERNKETSVKLSAMSMLLSSYQILNILSEVKDPDLEYLEMFVHVAEEVGKEYGLEPIQKLDLLVRDWSSSLVLGVEGGEEHLIFIRQMLKAKTPCKHPKALEVLSRSSSRCYLMPFPGEQITTGSEGTLRDMRANFRESLRDYVTALVSSASRHVRRDRHGELLTGTQLAAKIKSLSDVMKRHRSGFSSPCQMVIAFHNQRVLDRAHAAHADFLKKKDGLSQRMDDCLKVDPGAMEEQLVEQRRSLLGRCREEMKEPEETLLMELEAELTREAKTFLETYRRRYQHHATNKRAMDRARTDHADFLKEKGSLSQRMDDCLKVDPGAMVQQLAKQRRSLLGRCREEMKGPEETLLMELELELTREAETFLETYGERYQCYATNQRAMDRARAGHAAFLKEKDRDSRNPVKCLKVRPSEMAKQLAEQREHLLGRCRKDMLPNEEALGTELEVELMQKKEAQLTELKAGLTREAKAFLEAYGKRFKNFAIAAGAAAGAAAGVLVLAPVAAAAAAGITAAAIAAEAAVVLGMTEAVAIGVGTGAMAGMCVGGGVGGGVGGNIAQKDINRAEATASQGDGEDGHEELSDTTLLI